jgi:integration host factor subunit alpha
MTNRFISKSNILDILNTLNTLNTLTKADITQLLVLCNNLPKREAKQLVDLFFEEIYTTLSAGSEVKLTGFGTFEVRQRKSNLGRNIGTGTLIPIAARKVVHFLPSQKLKEKLLL